ncbi:MAG: ferrous iron transport protein B [Parasporobacterium sp.]|nr:ferrous iron transport protein B [Parasporobacterium sp.]
MTLKDLKTGDTAVIDTVGGDGALRQHFLDMGVIPGVEAAVIRFAPMGDPMSIRIHGYELTLRLSEAEKIAVREVRHCGAAGCTQFSDSSCVNPTYSTCLTSGCGRCPRAEHMQSVPAAKRIRKTSHPHLGEKGIHHDRKTEHPLADDHVLTFALVGNQNCGKTTLFNRLTGSHQHVGNFPGVTVDRKDGSITGYPRTSITDLPGIYSMSPYTSEELVSRNFVLDSRPDAIINIVDATNIERNLYLTMQLLEMDIPMVIALNMMDELTGNGGSIDVNAMESYLGVPVVPISAAKNSGIEELISHAIHIAKYQEPPVKKDFCSKEDYGGSVHRCLHAVIHLIEDHAENAGIPVRFAAGKAIEGDALIIEKLVPDKNETELLEHITLQMEKERGLDRSAAIADMRFRFIDKVCRECVRKPKESKERARSEKIDRILTGKYTAIPVFIAIMGLIFFLTFNVIGAWLQELLGSGIAALTDLVDTGLTAAGASTFIHSLVIQGIFNGVGSVLSFLPIVVVMFFFLSILEDSGYVARVAFFMDKLLRKLGLSGRSIVPMLIGFGCTVPAVMATRTLPSQRDRRMTIVLTPFMSCTAKLPVYAFFVNAFFPKQGGLVMIGLYVLGILIGILTAIINKKFVFKGEAVPFVMELPNYRLPSLRSTLQLMWEKSKDFLQKAFSIILIASIVIWFLQSFRPDLTLAEDSSQSIMAAVAGFIAPVLKPLGLGDWRIVTALISGFIAKESVVSALQVLFGAAALSSALTPAAAGTMLVFCLLYTPCIAAIAAVRRELGRHFAVGLVFVQCGIAWIAAFIFRMICTLFGAI